MRLDERSGAFFALGIALSAAEPVVILTTSGTAAAELHAAIAEADLARVPLIVATADRPVELHDVGAPQTIDQVGLFGSMVRYALDLPVATEETRPHWRAFASRLAAESKDGPRGAGPVHVNIAYREPMVGPIGPLPPGRDRDAPWHEVVHAPNASADAKDRLMEALSTSTRGVIVIGGATIGDATPIVESARTWRWPVLNDGRALRRSSDEMLISHGDQFLRSDVVTDQLRPDLVIHVGSPHASKTLMTWNRELAASGVTHVFVDPFGAFEDPERIGSLYLAADASALFSAVADQEVSTAPGWLERWQRCDRAVDKAVSATVDGEALSEPGIARAVMAELGADDTVFCSSSMPVRDVEWFAPATHSAPRVLANRGANGIDGVVSSVLGAAVGTSGRTIGLIGDLAFLHDLSGLVWGSAEEVPTATFVVVDNAGGGIFSFLTYPDLVDATTFERGFGTPQRGSLAAIASALCCTVIEVTTRGELRDALSTAQSVSGIVVILARTDRAVNVSLHQRLQEVSVAAAEEALSEAIGR